MRKKHKKYQMLILTQKKKGFQNIDWKAFVQWIDVSFVTNLIDNANL